MTLLIISFIAGMLTVLAPCILPLLPVVIGTAATGRGKWTPLIVIGSLSASIIAFTFLLKASTFLIDVPQSFWSGVSGGILMLFGLTLAFPQLWARVPGIGTASTSANKALGAGVLKKNAWGDVIVGVALGPIFSTCSPTYFVILATVLPASIALGTVYLLAYVLGLALMLFGIAYIGQRFANRLALAADSHGKMKRIIGAVFIVLGIIILTGYEKKLETQLLESGWFDVTKIEHRLLEQTEAGEDMPTENDSAQCEISGSELCADMSPVAIRDAIDNMKPMVKYREITAFSAFLNTNNAPITIGEQIEEGKVVLIDFLTYSCTNCRAVIPHLNRWHEEYHDDGLVVIGVHSPEFAFEHERSNVEKALASLGVTFPVVMDNDFETWRAYNNRYWPHLFLIDREGHIVYDHVGEGNYDITETKIRELLGLPRL
jgi:cytochrome c biogenesis protein CcdA/thiol-disulfide isomerase/thioredoxin